MALFSFASWLPRSRRGNVAVEFAMIAPVLGVVATGLFEYGSAVNTSAMLRDAARAGIQYATAHPTDAAGIQQAVLGSLGVRPGDVDVKVGTFCECNGGTATCGSTCPDGSLADVFVAVSATKPTDPVFPPSAGFLPPQLVGSATFRVR
jgi:Flp pilus assembly protein TadG